MSEQLKPWEQGYVIPEGRVIDKKALGKVGGLTAQARRAAGLPHKEKSDHTGTPGQKRTSVEREEHFAKMTEENLPLKKKMFLDRFVYEYLHDFNSSMAFIRAGGTAAHATTGGPESLRTAYVQTQLRNVTEMVDEEKLVTRGEVIMGIKKEAHYFGDDGSSSARVRAWGMLAKIKGMDVPKAPELVNDLPPGGVMEVPMIASPAEWAEQAVESQLALKNDVRK